MLTVTYFIGERALTAVINQFFSAVVKKKTTNKDNKKIQIKLARKSCPSRKAKFGPSKYAQLSLPKMCYRSFH